jgi:DNA-directed RNA polymerase subunit RPC12/RpoP
MSIVFFCQNCGARFDVDDGAAGKKGRCKHCRQQMIVPEAGTLASLAATPHLALISAAHARAAAESPGGASDWLAQVGSQVALAPLTVDRMPGLRKPIPKPTPLDDLGDSKPYSLVEAPRPRRVSAGSSKPAGEAKILWRRQLGTIQKLFRWINETAYLISVPFIMLILLGAMMHSRPLALTGATIVIALNLGRIISGLANIIVIPFRESPLQGVLFLIPPLTFVYMANNWKKMKRPTGRVLGPLLTISLVILAFAFIPSLSSKAASSGSVKSRLRSTVKDLKQSMKSDAAQLQNIDLSPNAAPPAQPQ